MTLNELTLALSKANPEAPLVFDAPSGQTGPGYHVTEFKLAGIESIDCGGNRDAWHEANLQIQDGQGAQHMSVGKFLQIAARSAGAIPGLGTSPLRVEFSPGNARLEVLSVGAPRIADDAVVVPLGAERALCKPLVRAVGSTSTASCCGSAQLSSCC